MSLQTDNRRVSGQFSGSEEVSGGNISVGTMTEPLTHDRAAGDVGTTHPAASEEEEVNQAGTPGRQQGLTSYVLTTYRMVCGLPVEIRHTVSTAIGGWWTSIKSFAKKVWDWVMGSSEPHVTTVASQAAENDENGDHDDHSDGDDDQDGDDKPSGPPVWGAVYGTSNEDVEVRTYTWEGATEQVPRPADPQQKDFRALFKNVRRSVSDGGVVSPTTVNALWTMLGNQQVEELFEGSIEPDWYLSEELMRKAACPVAKAIFDRMPDDCPDVAAYLDEESVKFTGHTFDNLVEIGSLAQPQNYGIDMKGKHCWIEFFHETCGDQLRKTYPPVMKVSDIVLLVDQGYPMASSGLKAHCVGKFVHVEKGGSMPALKLLSALHEDQVVGMFFDTAQMHTAQAWDTAQRSFQGMPALMFSLTALIAEVFFVLKVFLNAMTEMEFSSVIGDRVEGLREQLLALFTGLWWACTMFVRSVNYSARVLGVLNLPYRVQLWFCGLVVLSAVTVRNFVKRLRALDTLSLVICYTFLTALLFPTIVLVVVSMSTVVAFAVSVRVAGWRGVWALVNVWLGATIAAGEFMLTTPLFPVLKFVVNAYFTVWILTTRPIRGQVFVEMPVDGEIRRYTDTYSATDDKKEVFLLFVRLTFGERVMTGVVRMMLVGGLLFILGIAIFVSLTLRSTVHLSSALFRTFVYWSIAMILVPQSFLVTSQYSIVMLKEWVKALAYAGAPVIAELWVMIKVRLVALKEFTWSTTPHVLDGFNTHMTLPKLKWALFRTKMVGVMRYNVTRFVVAVENVDLPKLLHHEYVGPSETSLKESLAILRELGWPVNTKIYEDKAKGPTKLGEYKDWYMTSSDFIQPLRNIKTVCTAETALFKAMGAPTFKHTGSYTSEKLEVDSTARYYKNNVSAADVDVVDDVWEMVEPHFKDSRLVKTARVVNKLIKKYSAGFGFMDPTRPKTMSRKVLMAMVGGEAKLVELFDKTVEVIGKIVPVAHVFTKFETLKESKWINGMVRTIIGVPLAHYANTSKFSYMQNLRHPFDRTPIKVGMPLTGAWFADIWLDHSKRQNHFNGDLKQADSSYSPEIFDVIRAVRKRGFKGHRDYTAIAEMVDIAYDQLMTMPLAYKSTGVISRKGDGGATGQGNTSVDNSVALVTLYMAAWKNITGKSAREFNLYNTLSNQADDHILSWDKNDLGWNPKAWMAEFDRLGVTLTDESNSNKLEDCTFLAKQIVPDRNSAMRTLKKYGISVPDFMTCHNKDRLLGKLAAEQPLKDHQTRAKRLASYIWLTAHHEDVYRSVVDAIRVLQSKSKSSLKVKVPPYAAVMKAWYTKKEVNMHDAGKDVALSEDMIEAIEAYDQFGDVGDVAHIHEPVGLEVALICLSMLPQVFSPRFMTNPAIRHIHRLLGERVTWPIEFLKRRNPDLHTVGGISAILTRSNYDFLNGVDLAHMGSRRSDFSLLLSHWLFNILQHTIGGGSGPKGLNMLLRSVDSLVANFYFLAFGQTVNVVEAVGFGYVDTLLLVICDLVPNFAISVALPTMPVVIPSNVIVNTVTKAWRNIQPSASIDFEEIDRMVNRPGFYGSNNVIGAPTGVGKSTRMVSKIATLVAPRRVIVVEPRHLLVTGLCDYMNLIDPQRGYGAATTGRSPSSRDQVIYCTYQAMVLSNLGTGTDIVIIDEAHVKDPAHAFAVMDIMGRSVTTILTTATPDPGWQVQFPLMRFWNLQVAQLWRVIEHEMYVKTIDDFVTKASSMARGLGKDDKALFFMPTIKLCEKMAELLPGSSAIISSKHTEYDKDAQFFVSTRVADAGLTIPDVSFVFSMDIEFGVSQEVSPDQLWAKATKTGYYKLDELTIKQRRGRTGRTCDGTFFLFRMLDQLDERKTTPYDLLNELSQLLDLPHIEEKLNPDARVLWESYKTLQSVMGMSYVTPQNLFGDQTHFRNPSAFMKKKNEDSALYGMPGTDPISNFEPLRMTNILPHEQGEIDYNKAIEVAEEAENHHLRLKVWKLDTDIHGWMTDPTRRSMQYMTGMRAQDVVAETSRLGVGEPTVTGDVIAKMQRAITIASVNDWKSERAEGALMEAEDTDAQEPDDQMPGLISDTESDSSELESDQTSDDEMYFSADEGD